MIVGLKLIHSCKDDVIADGRVQLKSIQGLEQLIKLRRLIVREWTKLEELPSMETLTSTLEKLWAEGSVKLKTSARLGAKGRPSRLPSMPGIEGLVTV